MATFAGADVANVRWRSETPACYESSANTWRSFCPRCGSPIAYESFRFPGEIHFYHGTLSDPDSMPATIHVHAGEQLAWFEVEDDCPRYEKTGSGKISPLRRGPRRNA